MKKSESTPISASLDWFERFLNASLS
jgi:hypothetical protein